MQVFYNEITRMFIAVDGDHAIQSYAPMPEDVAKLATEMMAEQKAMGPLGGCCKLTGIGSLKVIEREPEESNESQASPSSDFDIEEGNQV